MHGACDYHHVYTLTDMDFFKGHTDLTDNTDKGPLCGQRIQVLRYGPDCGEGLVFGYSVDILHQPQPLLHKKGLRPVPQTPMPSPGQGLNLKVAETVDFQWALVSRDTR